MTTPNNASGCALASDDYCRFIKDFDFYARWYEELQWASWEWKERLESVYRNHCGGSGGLRDRNVLYLASLVPGEDDETVRRKIRTVAAFIEVVVARISWKGWRYNTGSVYDAMEKIVLKIRRKGIDEIVSTFETAQDEWWFKDRFREPSEWGGASGNRRRTHRLLARMTEYLETQSGAPSRYEKLVQTGWSGYDVEHIWADHWEPHREEFPQKMAFIEARNRIGGLVLLPSSVNKSLRDSTFADKRSAYVGKTSLQNEESPRNLLVRSLVTPPADIPGFGEFVERSGLRFRACTDFKKADLEARDELYQELGQRIWSIDAIREAAGAERP